MYIWLGSKTTQEEAIHAEQMGRTMFEVSRSYVYVWCCTGTLLSTCRIIISAYSLISAGCLILLG